MASSRMTNYISGLDVMTHSINRSIYYNVVKREHEMIILKATHVNTLVVVVVVVALYCH